jgi:hypothetical protein
MNLCMRFKRLPPVALAVLLQIMPVGRMLYNIGGVPNCGFAVLSRWLAGAVALMGSYHAVSGATISINSPTTATGTNGQPFSYRITTTDTFSNMRYYATPVPGGLTELSNSVSPFISGTPTNVGTTTVNLTVAAAGYPSIFGTVTITITNTGPPQISMQPNSQAVDQGSNATFSVNANGAGPLSYQWQFNSADIPLATATNYTVSAAQLADQGNYSVVVSNSLGHIASSNAFLTVYVPPAITNQPQSLVINQGSNAIFNVGATGIPSPAYQWKFNGSNIAQATFASYTVSNAQLASQGNYSVLVTNAGGSTTSSNAVLTVNAPPAITLQPVNRTVNQGNTTFLTVGVSGSPTLYYQWMFGGSNVSGATSNPYQIHDAQPSQAGGYFVVVTNSYGAVTSAVATVTVISPPAITSQPQSQNVGVGSNATFTVTATGGNLSYQWLFNVAAIGGASSSAYTLTNAQSSNAGNYSVFVTNTLGTVMSSNAVLAVTQGGPPPLILQGAIQGQQFVISFNAVPGQGYAIEYVNALESSSWITLTNVTATGTNASVSDPITNANQRFYRAGPPTN